MIVPIRLSPLVKIFLITYAVVFVCLHVLDRFLFQGWFFQAFALVPTLVSRGAVWQLWTYTFLHGDVMHVFFNGLVFAWIGSEIEYLWGKKKFFLFYSFCAVFSACVYLLGVWIFLGNVSFGGALIGASGVIYGLLVVYGVYYAERTILAFFLFPMKVKHFVLLIAFFEFFTTLSATGAHFWSSIAHMGGILAGVLWIFGPPLWKKMMFLKNFSRSMTRKKKHLRILHTHMLKSSL